MTKYNVNVDDNKTDHKKKITTISTSKLINTATKTSDILNYSFTTNKTNTNPTNAITVKMEIDDITIIC